MRRLPLDSSSLASAGFDAARNILEVEFGNGHVYQYFDVPESVFSELLEAGSKGRYFIKRVRGPYRFKRLS